MSSTLKTLASSFSEEVAITGTNSGIVYLFLDLLLTLFIII